MTSKPSSTDALTEILKDLLITRAHNDALGAISLNVTDGLFAIASAINHLADVQDQRRREVDRTFHDVMGDGEGHA